MSSNAAMVENHNGFPITRYFTQHGMLPPLALCVPNAVATNSTTIASSEQQAGGSLPVVYTNDPSSVYKWLSNNLPFDGCSIGFDVEVSVSLSRYVF
jgi:hypothetical protein